MLQLGGMLTKLMQIKSILYQNLETKSPVDGQFSQFLEKNNILTSIGLHFEHFKAIGKNEIAEIRNLLEILELSMAFLAFFNCRLNSKHVYTLTCVS